MTSLKKIETVVEDQVISKTKGGVKWSALQLVARNVVNLGVTAILARILAPSDYGLIGMVTVLIALLQVFSDIGLGLATVQRKSLSNYQVSNLFWISVLVGFFIFVCCLMLATPLSNFYDREEIKAVTAILGIGFILGGISAQPMALINRKMDFKKIAKIEVISMLLGAFMGLLSAYNGAGYWSLVIQTITVQLIRTLLAFIFSNIELSKPKTGVGTFQLVAFGITLTINGLLIYVARNLDSILIGKYWGAEELGLYNRAYFLMLLPGTLATGVLSSLMIPSLSSLQSNNNKFGNAYRKALKMITVVSCPLAIGLGLSADEVVYLIYGEKWAGVVPIISCLAIASVTQPLFNTTGWLFTAAGKAKQYLWLTAISSCILTVAFFLAIPHGTLAIAKVYGVTMGILIFVPALWYSHTVVNLSIRTTLYYLMPTIVCLFTMTASVYMVGLIEIENVLLMLITKVLVGLTIYSIMIFLFDKETIALIGLKKDKIT
jgi:PST family polysaccharide transporter